MDLPCHLSLEACFVPAAAVMLWTRMLSHHWSALEADASAERGSPGGRRSDSTRATRGSAWEHLGSVGPRLSL